MRLALALFLLPAAALAGDELNPDTVAEIHHEQDQAMDKINQEHGNKKPSEMSQEERLQFIEESEGAKQQIFDKHGVDDKSFSRYEASESLDERAAQKTAEDQIKQKEEAAKKAAAQKKEQGPQEIVIQRGLGDKRPIQLDANGEPLPQEDTTEEGVSDEAAPTEAPPPKHKGHGGKRSHRKSNED